MSLYKRPNILFLKAVFPSDLEGDDFMFDDRFTEAMVTYDSGVAATPTKSSVRFESYNSIPTVFTSLASWPKYTNLKCWNCDRHFKTRPWFVPDEFREIEGELEIGVVGNFCKENCAQSWIDGEYRENTQEHDDKTKYLKMLYKIFTGKSIEIIVTAEKKTLMKQYIGEDGITEEEYDKKTAERARMYSLSNYKIEHLRENNTMY